MASTKTTHNNCSIFPLLNLPLELRECIYRMVLPHTIRPRSLPETICETEGAQRSLIALFLINKQLHAEIFHALIHHSHFLISVESGIMSWELNQLEDMPVQMASIIRRIDIEIDWLPEWGADPLFVRRLRLWPLLEDHLRAFGRLKTLTVAWWEYGDLEATLRVERAILILEPLEELQLDLPGVQIRARGTGDQPGGGAGCVSLSEYMSELRKDGNRSNVG